VRWFDESLHLTPELGYTQRFEVTRVVCREKTEYQDLTIFETPTFGRVLALDGIVQTTERDEFAYHEMLAHVPVLAHGAAARVLIIGGGDGGTLREVLRHRTVEKATLVEIDGAVVERCREHLPGLNNGAFEDPRCELIIGDGIEYVAQAGEAFDVIIVDSTDPTGPGEGLFSEAFYAGCKGRLSAGGVMTAQNGVPFLQAEELIQTGRRLKPLFTDVAFYATAVPTYVGGLMVLAFATNEAGLHQLPEAVIAERFTQAGFETCYYTPAVHAAAFALPRFIEKLNEREN
jgi:spermidine synthase